MMLLVECQLSLDIIGCDDKTVIGSFRSMYSSKVCACIIEYVWQYSDRINHSACCLPVIDVVDKAFIECSKC